MLPIQPLKGEFRRPDLRNHRKILVVDGRVGFAGSQNLTEPGYNKPKNHKLGREWVELMTRVEGPVVAPAQRRLPRPTGTARPARTCGRRSSRRRPRRPARRGRGRRGRRPGGPERARVRDREQPAAVHQLIYAAQRRLSLTSPYFVPDESLLYAVTTAAQRGVDVELFVERARPTSSWSTTPSAPTTRRCSRPACGSGSTRSRTCCTPSTSRSTTPLAVIGSSNMDMRSFALNYEVVLMLTGAEVVARLREVEDTYRALSTELTMEEWREPQLGREVRRQRDAADLGPAVDRGPLPEKPGRRRLRSGSPW